MAVATLRGRRLANELRRLREAAGLTLDEAATQALISKSALSRIENALVTPRPLVLRALFQTYDVAESDAGRLSELAKSAAEVGWWQRYSDTWHGQLSYISFESEATAIRMYSPILIPGLMQTAEYAKALFQALGRTEEQVERSVSLRVMRLERMRNADLNFVVEESVLRRNIGGSATMKAQLARLIELSHAPGITLQVLPENIGGHVALDGHFVMLEFSGEFPAVAAAEGQFGQVWIEDPDEIATLVRKFDAISDAALDVKATRRLIQDQMENW